MFAATAAMTVPRPRSAKRAQLNECDAGRAESDRAVDDMATNLLVFSVLYIHVEQGIARSTRVRRRVGAGLIEPSSRSRHECCCDRQWPPSAVRQLAARPHGRD